MKYIVTEEDTSLLGHQIEIFGGKRTFHIFNTLDQVERFLSTREEGRNGMYSLARDSEYKVFELGKELKYEMEEETVEEVVTNVKRKVKINDN